MTAVTEHVGGVKYVISWEAPAGLRSEGTSPVTLRVHAGGREVGRGYLKLRREGFVDDALDHAFDQIVLSNVDLDPERGGRGLGTAIIRTLARQFPDVLFIGENPNEVAEEWHSKLNRVFPSRMVAIVDGVEARVTPGKPLIQASCEKR